VCLVRAGDLGLGTYLFVRDSEGAFSVSSLEIKCSAGRIYFRNVCFICKLLHCKLKCVRENNILFVKIYLNAAYILGKLLNIVLLFFPLLRVSNLLPSCALQIVETA